MTGRSSGRGGRHSHGQEEEGRSRTAAGRSWWTAAGGEAREQRERRRRGPGAGEEEPAADGEEGRLGLEPEVREVRGEVGCKVREEQQAGREREGGRVGEGAGGAVLGRERNEGKRRAQAG